MPVWRGEVSVEDLNLSRPCPPASPSKVTAAAMAEPRNSGFHAAAADRAEGRVDLQARFAQHPHATLLVRCTSEALISRAMLPGDLLVVDRSLEPRHGDGKSLAFNTARPWQRQNRTLHRLPCAVPPSSACSCPH